MAMCQFLPFASVRQRIAKYTDGALKDTPRSDQLAAAMDPGMMTNMMKQNVTSVVPNILMMTIATNFFGIWLIRRVSTALFYKIAYVLMFLISAELIRSGVLGVIRGA